MARSFDRVCRCCGTPFIAFNPTAKWCSSRCSMRAFQRRRRGAPEADHGVSFQPAALQAQIIDSPDDLPLAWRDHHQVTSLAPFAYQGRPLRVITDDRGVTWFVAADVCAALDLGNTWMTLERLDDDEKSTASIPTAGGAQSVTTVNEPGLYSLIFGSRKPDARAFKRWVTHEVLPAIRRTGSYSTAPAPQLTQGIHVVANSQRHANWLWALAVEEHVGRALMAGIGSNNQRRRTDPSYQLHLLPPAA
jgi:prophage antirepressor-like protein